MAIKYSDQETKQMLKLNEKQRAFAKETIELGEALKSHDLLFVPRTQKFQVTIRLDDEVLAALRATGKGWQTRVNSLLRAALKLQ